jgi:phosphate transport system substrate-binding protein
VATLLLSVALSGCSSKPSEGTIVVSGSTTILPIAEEAAEEFQAAHEGASVLVSGMGSSAGIEAVGITGTADIGTSSRNLKDEEETLGLTITTIAHDGIAVIVNPTNPVSNLTTEEIRAVFAGRITNWEDLGGKDLPITLINRDEASGTRDAFDGAIMEGEPFEVNAVVLPGTGQVREVITRTPGAIGYISVGFVEPRSIVGDTTNSRVKALNINGIEPTEEHIGAGTYPLSRDLFFLTKGRPSLLADEYMAYVLSDTVQEGAVRDAGFLPVSVSEGVR